MYKMNVFERCLCGYVGKVFMLAQRDGLFLPEFIDKFMNSLACEIMDDGDYHHGGKGYAYLYDEACDTFTCRKATPEERDKYGDGVLEWVGYIYRYWNYSTGMSSKEINKIIPGQRMLDLWFYGHTLSPDMFIEDAINGVIG